ncbi:MAG TPA: hypothetical protein VFK20_01190 [Vicinamibacterales bacterium]|nr:hypothetical protein [Vicinamibacterales bacterium]
MRVLLTLAAAATLLAAPARLTLVVRVFDGMDDVTADTRVKVYAAGDRGAPIAGLQKTSEGFTVPVDAGFYDVQVIHLRNGRVLGLRWAERLVVMAYPDEAGRHLEVVNLRSGFGALEVRGRGTPLPEVDLFAPGDHEAPAAKRIDGPGYALFVVPAGDYDLRVPQEGDVEWQAGLEVPVDRTRFLIVPSGQTLRPVSRRRTMTTSATTSRMWMSPPATFNAKPSTHRISSSTTMVQSMRSSLLPFADSQAVQA